MYFIPVTIILSEVYLCQYWWNRMPKTKKIKTFHGRKHSISQTHGTQILTLCMLSILQSEIALLNNAQIYCVTHKDIWFYFSSYRRVIFLSWRMRNMKNIDFFKQSVSWFFFYYFVPLIPLDMWPYQKILHVILHLNIVIVVNLGLTKSALKQRKYQSFRVEKRNNFSYHATLIYI